MMRLAEWRRRRVNKERRVVAEVLIATGIYGMEPIPPLSLQIVHEGMAMAEGVD